MSESLNNPVERVSVRHEGTRKWRTLTNTTVRSAVTMVAETAIRRVLSPMTRLHVIEVSSLKGVVTKMYVSTRIVLLCRVTVEGELDE